MADLQQFRYGYRLNFMSPNNQSLVAHYLTLLQARQYSPLTLEHVIGALKSLCNRLPPDRQYAITQDLTLTTANDIDDWLQASHHQGLAPSTIRSALGTLRQFFLFLLEEEHLVHQPIRRYRHNLVVPHYLPRPMAEADIVPFFQVIDRVRDRLMFLLMLRCGLRVSEVCSLTWSAIDSVSGLIRIDQGKDHVDRVVYFSSDVEQALMQWQGLQSSDSVYVFPSRLKRKKGQPLTPRLIQLLLNQYCQQAQIVTSYSPHCLRHSFATQLLNAGASLEVVKELMGHRHIYMTLRYTQLYDSNKRQQYDKAMAQVERRQSIGRR